MAGIPLASGFTPEMYMQAGLNPNRPITGNVGCIPITQADRDRLGEVRNRQLAKMNRLAKVTLGVSLVAILIGIIAVVLSGPTYYFPYSMGGGCLSGVMGLITSIICLKIVREGKKTPTGSETTPEMGSWLMSLVCVATIGIVFSVITMGFCGLWGLKDCIQELNQSTLLPSRFDRCIPDKIGNLILSAMTAVLCVTIALMLIALSGFYCCNNQRAFGQKTGFELLMDVQNARMQELLRLQSMQQAQQQTVQPSQQPTMYPGQPPARYPGQPPTMHHGQTPATYPGYQAQQPRDQMYPYQVQGQGYPLVPSAPTGDFRRTNEDNGTLPPTYDEVMNK